MGPKLLACAIAVAALGAAGCGTPASVTPSAAPLPGLGRDVQAAHNAVEQTQAQAQSEAATGATLP